MSLSDKQTGQRIADLNDAFRKTLGSTLGRVMLTAGVNDLSSDARTGAMQKVARFDAFDRDNDPHGEHDFGSFDLAERRIFFQDRLLRSPSRVRLRRPGRLREGGTRAHAHPRRGVLSHARQSSSHLRNRQLDGGEEAPRLVH